ncbi:MAG TPA: hypothetical protein VN840_03075 [Streptosporangiaceae bacterium]|nr:hypothetical protein [Streptosporangiaceae bacterium]
MIDTRIVGQELQDQVLAAARKGQQRVHSTVKQVTATAAMIRPQLPSLPRPTLNMPGLPTPAQIREKAPALTAMLPSTDQLKAGAHELAEQFMSVQRKAEQFMTAQRKVVDQVVDQVRSVTTPLAHQAAAVFAQVGAPVAKTAPAKAKAQAAELSENGKAEHAKAEHATAEHGKAEHGATEHGTTAAHRNGGTRKPRTKSAAK